MADAQLKEQADQFKEELAKQKIDFLQVKDSLRRQALRLAELRHYDVRVPLVGNVTWRHSYEQAVDVVQAALSPLGDDYGRELGRG